jgi:predicted RNase H-like HicB family nuclease
MTYRVVLHSSEEGYSVSCPSLPGCHSQGETENEALENIKSAIRAYLDAKAGLQCSEQVWEVDARC